MAVCTDPRFESMLYAYELGILPEADRAALEQHLMECDACFYKASHFEPAVHLLRESERVKRSVEALDGERSSRSSRRSLWLRSGLVAGAVLVVLLLRPWRLEFQTDQSVQAETSRLAVAPFQNLTGTAETDRLCEIATGLLVTDLSESHFVQVIPSDIDESIPGGDTTAPISPLEVARKAEAHWLLSGRIMQHLDTVSLDVKMLDVKSGAVLAAARVDGSDESSIFSLIDSLTKLIKADLPLPSAARTEYDPEVAEVTTHSPEAYYHYLQGVKYQYQYFNQDAIASFEKALEYDSTLAMAYYYLAGLSDGGLIDKAVEYSGRLSQKERLMILSRAATAGHNYDSAIVLLTQLVTRYPDEKTAWYRLGQMYELRPNHDSAIAAFKRVIELDPRFEPAYNSMAYAYNLAGVPDSAIWAIDKYVELAPDQPNPYDSRGDLYAFNGEPEKAALSYARAVEIRPSFAASNLKLAQMYIFLRRFDDASAILHRYADNPNDPDRVTARLYLPFILLAQGQFDRALNLLDSLTTLTRDEFAARGQAGVAPSFNHLKALIYIEREDWQSALQETEAAISAAIAIHPNDSLYYQSLYVYVLNKARQPDSASRVLDFLARHENIASNGRFHYLCGQAMQAAAERDYARMVTASEELSRPFVPCSDFSSYYLLAQALLENGRLSRAVPLWEKLAATYTEGRMIESLGGVKVHYFLGRAYEESRWYDRSREQYELFLTAWGSSRPELASVRDARARLIRLETKS